MLFISADTMNTQVHDTTKQTPYELVFGQPPRAIFVPDVNFRGQLDEDGLKRPSEDVKKDKRIMWEKKRWMRRKKRRMRRKKRMRE